MGDKNSIKERRYIVTISKNENDSASKEEHYHIAVSDNDTGKKKCDCIIMSKIILEIVTVLVLGAVILMSTCKISDAIIKSKGCDKNCLCHNGGFNYEDKSYCLPKYFDGYNAKYKINRICYTRSSGKSKKIIIGKYCQNNSDHYCAIWFDTDSNHHLGGWFYLPENFKTDDDFEQSEKYFENADKKAVK